MSERDWIGSKESIFMTLGASNHTDKEREEHDYYATDPESITYLLQGGAEINHKVWECACGKGHLSKKLSELGYDVKSTDLVDRGYGIGGVDFLSIHACFDGDILTNPPYKYAREFVEHALEIIPDGRKVFMFLKLQFLEGKARRELFDKRQLKTLYVSSSRILCAPNGEFDTKKGSAVAYAWFEFQKGYDKDPVIKWIN